MPLPPTGMLDMIEQREKEQGITPDPDTAAYMTAMNKTGKYNFVTEVFIKLLGLDICSETLVVSRLDSLAGTADDADSVAGRENSGRWTWLSWIVRRFAVQTTSGSATWVMPAAG